MSQAFYARDEANRVNMSVTGKLSKTLQAEADGWGRLVYNKVLDLNER